MSLDKLLKESTGEHLYEYLEAHPEEYDTTFCVGPQKIIVQALKIVLKASLPIFDSEFKWNGMWETTSVRLENGQERTAILLPDLDPIAFELFIQLTILGDWSVDALKVLNLSPNELFNLLLICERLGPKTATKVVEECTQGFLWSFHEFKDTEEFLNLSLADLKTILGKDEILMDEMGIFECAKRWAVFQTKIRGKELKDKSIRDVLGDCFFEIRFPLMAIADFTRIVQENENILTQEEILSIYKYIGSADVDKKISHNSNQLLFKTKLRSLYPVSKRELLPNPLFQQNSTLKLSPRQKQTVPTSPCESLLSVKNSTLCITEDFVVTESPPYVCDGKLSNYVNVDVDQKIEVNGLGFLGPVSRDAFYNVIVEITGRTNGQESYATGKLQKRIRAKKGQIFHFTFDKPIALHPITETHWERAYDICFAIKGPKTLAVERVSGSRTTAREDGVEFNFFWESNQLADIQFTKF